MVDVFNINRSIICK